jgi:methionine salvage enolase-phosphatase E1
MLRRFHDLVGQAVKTDKGFKDVHVRQVASMVSKFAGVNVSTQQIYNHLRKWRQRWVKIVRLKDLSGALWSEEHHMICLDDEHLNGHTKVKTNLPKPY